MEFNQNASRGSSLTAMDLQTLLNSTRKQHFLVKSLLHFPLSLILHQFAQKTNSFDKKKFVNKRSHTSVTFSAKTNLNQQPLATSHHIPHLLNKTVIKISKIQITDNLTQKKSNSNLPAIGIQRLPSYTRKQHTLIFFSTQICSKKLNHISHLPNPQIKNLVNEKISRIADKKKSKVKKNTAKKKKI